MSGESSESALAGRPATGTIVAIVAGLGLLGFFVFRRALRGREAR
jgi:hypothetical protein